MIMVHDVEWDEYDEMIDFDDDDEVNE